MGAPFWSLPGRGFLLHHGRTDPELSPRLPAPHQQQINKRTQARDGGREVIRSRQASGDPCKREPSRHGNPLHHRDDGRPEADSHHPIHPQTPAAHLPDQQHQGKRKEPPGKTQRHHPRIEEHNRRPHSFGVQVSMRVMHHLLRRSACTAYARAQNCAHQRVDQPLPPGNHHVHFSCAYCSPNRS